MGLWASCEAPCRDLRLGEPVSHRTVAYVDTFTVDRDLPTGYGLMISTIRSVRTRADPHAGVSGTGDHLPPAMWSCTHYPFGKFFLN
jgi:hypothetical protein